MAEPEPDINAPPGDAEALAAARAEFWVRWRGELPYVEASRPATLAARSEAAPAPKLREQERCAVVRGPRRRKTEVLLARFERLIGKELIRCESCMTADEWREHRAWVEENARGSLWDAMTQRSHRGAL
ncbi:MULTISPECIES: hypothetical protein [Paraburkholderia]|uniref:hypothetical protein n=1 Tax=Paraburkholderia TaxID=1822464 RepID=UPI0013A6F9CF|nr:MULTISPECIES: hypothetical protein [Paraburkholderia]MDH6150605.1 hypothetical protein [Paraburkholderia sp. WSM4179]